jgi:HD-like signal output (HDOD) protein
MKPPIPSIDEVCRKALNLPCSPSLLPRLTAILQSEDGTAEEIEALILLDTALATSTLRLANSVFYGTSRKIDSVAEAVVRLGQKEIYRLAALALVSRWETQVSDLPWEPGDFCRFSLCTACAAEVLAEMTEAVDPTIAYTAGLVGDIGRLAVTHACGPHLMEIRDKCRATGRTWDSVQREILGYSDAEVSARLLKTWLFSEQMIAAARYQDAPLLAPAHCLPLLANLHAARFLAITMGPGAAETSYWFTLQLPFLEEWGMSKEMLEEALPSLLQSARAKLQGKLLTGSIDL